MSNAASGSQPHDCELDGTPEEHEFYDPIIEKLKVAIEAAEAAAAVTGDQELGNTR